MAYEIAKYTIGILATAFVVFLIIKQVTSRR
jgi:hypothetical protein